MQGGDNSMQTIKINGVSIIFDREKTNRHRTEINSPCECDYCRNYYKNMSNNIDLVDFLESFGVDYNYCEEIFSWDLGNDKDSLIHHEGHYCIFGKIEGDEFEFERFGVKIAFSNLVPAPCDGNDEHFWLSVKGDFPYILDEIRNLVSVFPQKAENSNMISKLKSIFRKKQFYFTGNDK